MKPEINKVLVVVNVSKDDAEITAREIERYLQEKGLAVTVFGFSGRPEPPRVSGYDLAFSLGGDGTVLFSARLLAPHRIRLLLLRSNPG